MTALEGARSSPPVDVQVAPPLIVIAGATATGKTGLSIALAERLAEGGQPAEIISADSRQVFRGLDIGTAKVTTEERARVPHHGLDLADPDQAFSVADFVAHTRLALAGIAERGAVALLVGGTGFYLRAVGRGLDIDALPSDPVIRAGLEDDLRERGPALMAERLVATAPLLAVSIDLRNPRRVIRALEIALVAGDHPRPEARGYPGPSLWLGLSLDAQMHHRWIVDRARGQFAAGLLDEAAALRERYDAALPAFSAIGYREAWAVIDGELSLEAATALDVQRNSAFARRQRTWFRSEPNLEWFNVAADPLEPAFDRVTRFLDRPAVS